MKFFIDTADVEEIREATELGLIDGVTTNPSLVAKTGRPSVQIISVDTPANIDTQNAADAA